MIIRYRIESVRQAQRQRHRAFDFERHIGEHGHHQRLFGQHPAKRDSMRRLMQRVSERAAHHAGATDHTIEPRMLDHLERLV